ncbi:MAG: BMC domain-containing protein [Candidatus Neomarinimicrobiota bacterium]|nr:MAG: BMC domain-containing protein [Candidatus Neomarinimicrobiota bacterium]
MIKTAPITVMKAGTVHNGKYLVLIGGSVGSVEEAYRAGSLMDPEALLDRVLLPRVHHQVRDGILGCRQTAPGPALGILETATAAACVRAADPAVKGAEVTLTEIRLADDLGGKAFALFSGDLFAVETALNLALGTDPQKQFALRPSIIPQLHPELSEQVTHSSWFGRQPLTLLREGEL